MKTIVLIKQYPVIQLGHLYEHLFLRRVNKFFYDHGLYKSLDYGAYGTTYERSGIITIECWLYSPEAIALESEIEQLRIDLGEENRNVSIALHQITAEEPFKLYVSNKAKTMQELEKIAAAQWSHIDTFGTFDSKSTRRRVGPIYLTHQQQTTPRQLRFTVSLDKDTAHKHRNLLPLFVFIGRMILLTTNNRVAAIHGAYSGEFHVSELPSVISYSSITKQAVSLTSMQDISETIQSTLASMLHTKTLTRIATNLSAIDYASDLYAAPSFEHSFTETGILLGAQGWRTIATIENIENLLRHSTVEIKLGRQKMTLPILPPDK